MFSLKIIIGFNMRKKPRKIRNLAIPSNQIYFQYEPGTFLKEFFRGDESQMLRVDNSPHFEFVKLYKDIGKDIWDCYKETRYIRLMIAWGRDDKHNRWKADRFISTYESILKKGLFSRVVVLNEPMYKKFFVNGYEIFHGHHRSAICAVLSIDPIPCTVSKI